MRGIIEADGRESDPATARLILRAVSRFLGCGLAMLKLTLHPESLELDHAR
jgi:hypothetical protein